MNRRVDEREGGVHEPQDDRHDDVLRPLRRRARRPANVARPADATPAISIAAAQMGHMAAYLPGRFPYSSWRRHQGPPASLRPFGARSSHWYMPQSPSSPRA